MALENFGVNETVPEGLASDGQNIYMVGQSNKALYRVNPVTGETKQLGSIKNFGAGEFKPVGLAFHKGVLYMTGRTGRCLYKVSTDTGRASQIGNFKNFGGVETKPQGLASDGEKLYMTGAQQNMLYVVEVEGENAGKATKVGSFEDQDNEPRGLTYHPEEKMLYMIGAEQNALYSADPAIGQLKRVEHPDDFDVEETRPTGVTYHKDGLYITGQAQAKLYKLGEGGIGKAVEKFEGIGALEVDETYTSQLRPESGQVTAQSGGNSRLLFAEQINYWTPVGGHSTSPVITTRTQNQPGVASVANSGNVNFFYKYQPIVTSIGLTNQTATIPIEFLKGTSGANKQQAGGLAYAGGFGIGASPNGTQLFFKGITNNNPRVNISPTSRNLGGSLNFNLGSGSSRDISGEPLPSGSYFFTPRRLKVTKGGNTGGSIIVEGYDYHNQKIRETLTFKDGANQNATTRSYFRIPLSNLAHDKPAAGSVYTTIPLKLIGNIGNSANSSIASVADERVIATFTPNDSKTFKGWTVEAQKGAGVCHTYIGVIPVSFTTSLARDSALTYDFECLAYGMNQYTNAAGEDTKGIYDRPSAGMNIGSFTKNIFKFTFSSASTLAANEIGDLPSGVTVISVNPGTSSLSHDISFSRHLTTDELNAITISSKTIATRALVASQIPFKKVEQELATGWQSNLRIATPGGLPETIPLLDSTFTLNQTVEQAQVIMGERNPGPYFRSGLREVTLSGNMLLTKERDWITEFEANSSFTSCELILANIPTGGFPYQTKFSFGAGQLTAAPDASVDGLGLISVPFNMTFFQEGNDNDFEIEVTYKKSEWDVQQAGTDTGGLYSLI